MTIIGSLGSHCECQYSGHFLNWKDIKCCDYYWIFNDSDFELIKIVNDDLYIIDNYGFITQHGYNFGKLLCELNKEVKASEAKDCLDEFIKNICFQ